MAKNNICLDSTTLVLIWASDWFSIYSSLECIRKGHWFNVIEDKKSCDVLLH